MKNVLVVLLLALALSAGVASAESSNNPMVETMRKLLADPDYQAMDGLTQTNIFMEVLTANSPEFAAIKEPAIRYCAAFEFMAWLEKKPFKRQYQGL